MSRDKKLRVFLIEDAPRIRAILMEVLQSHQGIDVIGYAENETDAVRDLRSIEWDLAIVDIALKQGNGLGVLEALNKDNRQYGKRIVFSGDASPLLKKRVQALGADGVFDKASDMDGLLHYVETIM
jgi:DNA-binding NarL/FixJ family response regulator